MLRIILYHHLLMIDFSNFIYPVKTVRALCIPIWAVLGLARQGPWRLEVPSILDVCAGPRLGASGAPFMYKGRIP